MVVVERVADPVALRGQRPGSSGCRPRRGPALSMTRGRAPRAARRGPADASRSTKGLELPSIAGSSLPLTSTTRLSMPMAAVAAIRCSIVRTLTPKAPIVVAKWESTTWSIVAGIRVPSGARNSDARVCRGRGEGQPDGLARSAARPLRCSTCRLIVLCWMSMRPGPEFSNAGATPSQSDSTY